MNKRHINIPIFIPHLGCPNNCVFCNQRSISGRMEFREESVRDEIENALKTVPQDAETEIAFFGGSFTGIDRGLMMRLLGTAKEYIDAGKVTSVRLSTRPDYIDEEILTVLSEYGVKDVELGIQSMDDEVLKASKRGHTAEASERACRLVKKYGFRLVGQMMTGLPCSTMETEIMTAEKICALGADGARIYPTMVFHNTELEAMMKTGGYVPPELDDAVARSADVLDVFVKNNVPVIRIGLHSGESLYTEDGISAGAYHAAMGELVEGELYFKKETELLSKMPETEGKHIVFAVNPSEISKAIGQKRHNAVRLTEKYKLRSVKAIPDTKLEKYDVTVKTEP